MRDEMIALCVADADASYEVAREQYRKAQLMMAARIGSRMRLILYCELIGPRACPSLP